MYSVNEFNKITGFEEHLFPKCSAPQSVRGGVHYFFVAIPGCLGLSAAEGSGQAETKGRGNVQAGGGKALNSFGHLCSQKRGNAIMGS